MYEPFSWHSGEFENEDFSKQSNERRNCFNYYKPASSLRRYKKKGWFKQWTVSDKGGKWITFSNLGFMMWEEEEKE